MWFIGCPFGNYLKLNGLISVNGSFTIEPRDGLLLQILKTLRYSFKHGGWINKIGLRNPGIDAAITNWNKNEIYSVAIIKRQDIAKLVEKVPKDMNLEVNVSCPNVDKDSEGLDLSGFVNQERKWCIIKLSPMCDAITLDNYYKQGFRQFHCCNTIPVKEGGLSGKAIMPYSLNLISHIRAHYPDAEIIGGGGIETIEDVEVYREAGANHFSISSVCFTPWKLFNLIRLKID